MKVEDFKKEEKKKKEEGFNLYPTLNLKSQGVIRWYAEGAVP